jgi:peptide/nickel transport system ATP-binding protein
MLDESPAAKPGKHDEYDGPILEIENLSISFFTRLREIPAVMDFSCKVHAGRSNGPRG